MNNEESIKGQGMAAFVQKRKQLRGWLFIEASLQGRAEAIQ